MRSISVVVPVYNDEDVLKELHKRLVPVIQSLTDKYEIILVDDGSKDHSWEEICKLKEKDPNIVAVKLMRNFGQQNSIAAGLSLAKGDLVTLMDSDLQDRPEDIPTLIEALDNNNASMAIAQRATRKDSHMKKFLSSMFYHVSESITEIHVKPKLGCFRVMKHEVIEELNRLPEKTSTSLSLLYYIGSNYVAVPLNRDARFAGASGYTLRKMLSLTFARIFSFSMFPIRMATYVGFSITFLSFIVGLFLIIRRLLKFSVPGWTSIVVLMLFLFGINFAFLGILGEYIGRIFLETRQRPKYIIEVIK